MKTGDGFRLCGVWVLFDVRGRVFFKIQNTEYLCKLKTNDHVAALIGSCRESWRSPVEAWGPEVSLASRLFCLWSFHSIVSDVLRGVFATDLCYTSTGPPFWLDGLSWANHWICHITEPKLGSVAQVSDYSCRACFSLGAGN